MTAYTMTGSGTLRNIGTAAIFGVTTARSGGDTFALNGWNLTIDQDTRFGLSGTTTTSLGNITVSATLGGNINIDGRYVRMIPFTGGSGTITAGSTITMGSGTGVVIGIYSSLTTAPVLTGVATGWIKVTAWNQIAFPTSGAFTQAGYTFTISGASIVGFIDVVGDEGSGIIANRLGTANITGEWFQLGTTNGVANQTMQCPNNGTLRYLGGVFIEKTVGSNNYEFYPNAGTATTIGTDATRGKVVWVDANGLVRIGHNGTANSGYTPVTGLKVVVGNVFLENCTTAARAANVIPNAAVATRYDFTTTGGGVVTADKCNFAWYPSFAQPFSVNLSNCGVVDAVLVSECASTITWTKVGVGNKPTTALLTNPLSLTLCFAGGTLTDCVWSRVSHATSGAHTNVLTDVAGFTFVNDTIRANTIRANATTYSLNATRCVNCTWTTPTIIQGNMYFTTCTDITATNTIYCDAVSSTTVTTYAMYVWGVASNSLNCTFSGLSLPVTNCQPYTALLLVASAGCANIKLRSIGSRVAPLSLGSTNNVGLIYVLAAQAAATDVKIQRVYCATTRTGIMTGDNSSTRVTEENVFGDYADAADVSAVLNFKRKGIAGTLAVTAQTAVYGTHWYDCFTSATAGRIGLLMNEPTSLTTSQVTLANGAAFTSAGGLYMPVIGHQVIFETPNYVIGHTAFANAVGTMAGGTIGNYTIEFSIDKNNGAGYSTYVTASAANLSAVTGIDAQLGFKLKIRITTSVTNATAITSFYLTTVSTATAQNFQYPLETVEVKISCADAGTLAAIQDARVYLTAGAGGWLPEGTVILNTTTNALGVVATTIELAGTTQPVVGRARKMTSSPLYRNSPISGIINSSGLDITAFMVSDE